MYIDFSRAVDSRQIEPAFLGLAGADSCDDLEPCDANGPSRLWEDLWDAFELDDETAEPQPEQGDFWGQPDREEDS